MTSDQTAHHAKFRELIDWLKQVPAVDHNQTALQGFGSGDLSDGGWWVKFSIKIDHPLAWSTVQEFGHVLNYLSLRERLPTVFKPVSPPPYLNGGPRDFLSWVIECPNDGMPPGTVTEWLRGRLPQPVDDEAAWPKD